MDLIEFVTNRGSEVVDDVIRTTLDMISAPAEHDHLGEMRTRDVCCGCDGVWFHQAKDVLDRNGIGHVTFAKAVYELRVTEEDVGIKQCDMEVAKPICTARSSAMKLI